MIFGGSIVRSFDIVTCGFFNILIGFILMTVDKGRCLIFGVMPSFG